VCESLTHEPPGEHPDRGALVQAVSGISGVRSSAGALAQLRTVAATAST
jgi:hypothetical protein